MAESPEKFTEKKSLLKRIDYRYTHTAGLAFFVIMLAVGINSHFNNKAQADKNEPATASRPTAEKPSKELNNFAQKNLPGFTQSRMHPLYPASAIISPDGSMAFDTESLTKDIEGFNGPLRLLAIISADGKLQKFIIADHAETPAYVEKTQNWCHGLPGRNVCHQDFVKIDTVSGATYTSAAILQSLHKAATLLQLPGGDSANTKNAGNTKNALQPIPQLAAEHRPFNFDWHGVYLILAILAAITCRFIPDKRLRYSVLAANMLLGGWLLAAQFSTFHVLNIAKLQIPAVGLTPVFICFAGLPLVMLFTGNIYCGWICPFGALQELSTLTGRARHNPKNWQAVRFIKYLVLCTLLSGMWLFGNENLQNYDPLNFAYTSTTYMLITAGTVFMLAQILPVRFFCRYLCPTGAFLSLFNRIFIFKKLFPFILPGKCDLGIKSIKETDCLVCDRCRNGCTKNSN